MTRELSPKIEALIEKGVEMGALPSIDALHPECGGYDVGHSKWCRLINGGIECTCRPIIMSVSAVDEHTYVLVDKRTG